MDEVATWKDENSASPDIETYRAILPGLGSIPGSMLIGISSPYRKKGLLYDKWKEYFGESDDDILVIQGATRQFNPTWSQTEIDEALRKDPEAAAAEWTAKFREDIADYVDPDIVDAAVMKGVVVLPPERGINYVGFTDPSGGQRDSFTLAIAHNDRKGRGVLDCLYEVRAPFKPLEIVPNLPQVLKNYGLRSVRGDHYGGEWPPNAFAECNIHYEVSELTKSDIYREFLPHLNSGMVDLLDNQTMISQLCSLERRTARGGRDTIDHPKAGYDDMINSAAGVLQMVLDKNNQPIRVSAEAVARARAAVPRRAYRFN